MCSPRHCPGLGEGTAGAQHRAVSERTAPHLDSSSGGGSPGYFDICLPASSSLLGITGDFKSRIPLIFLKNVETTLLLVQFGILHSGLDRFASHWD